jgi:hypothetical protein
LTSSCLLLAALAACSGGSDVTSPGGGGGGGGGAGGNGGPPVTSQLTCMQPNGTSSQCDLTLTNAGGFIITLVSTSCDARGNTLTLLKPVQQTLLTDGCYSPPQHWTFPGPYPAGTGISLQIVSPQLQRAPSLQATGAYPDWTIKFEDGGDADLNDLVLQLQATH